MPLPKTYVLNMKKIPEFFKAIKDGQAPKNFSQQHLKDIGFASSNDRAFVPLLKALDFLTPEGSPTKRYLDYRDNSKSKIVLGQALKETYSDLFFIKSNPTKDDKQALQGKFKSVHNTSDLSAERMTNTFLELLNMADISSAPELKEDSKVEEPRVEEGNTKGLIEHNSLPNQLPLAGLYYNIQIHLPATKDIEVYTAIFKSLKEHLIA